MRLNDKNGVKYFTFDSFTKTGLVNHCFSTRVGGVSDGWFSSLNLGLSRGDDRERVTENYRRLGRCVGFETENIIYSSQVHDVKVYAATRDDTSKGLWQSQLKGYDGFVTDDPDLVLTVFTADCVPLYFLDPVKKAIGLSHSGWRGTVNGMALETVREMKRKFGCEPEDILAGVGPSICRSCFEVDRPVADEFYKKTPADFIKSRGNKYLIDLWGVNRYFMLEAGLKAENIELPGICTKCSPDLFYSHRESGDKRGSMAGFMMLKGTE